MNYNIWSRSVYLENIELQRRCYNGCHAKSEIQWTNWELLEFCASEEKANQRMQFWTELNDYAVSHRGPSAKREHKIVIEENNGR